MTKQEEIFLIRQRFLEKQQDELLKNVDKAQLKLYDEILRRIISAIKLTPDDTIEDQGKGALSNFQITDIIDDVFNAFQKTNHFGIVNTMVSDFSGIADLNDKYYSLFNVPKDRYSKIRKQARDFMRARLGLDSDGNFVKGGYLDQLVRDNQLRQQVKELSFRATVGGQTLMDLQDSLRATIVGSNEIDGGLARYYKGFAYDVYQQFDRANNKSLATKIGLRSLIYAGGIIENSRDFCIERNNKVFTIEEIQLWKDDPKLPRTKLEQKAGRLFGYIPEIDMGRYNCRHMSRWISKYLAIKLRPDLKEYYDQYPEAA